MTGLTFKHLKRLKFTKIGTLVLVTHFGVLGCASDSLNRSLAGHDEASHLRDSIQNSWNSHSFTASADYHFSLAQAYSAEGKVDRAIEEFQAALAYDADSAILHGKIAAEYLKKGATSLAIEHCKKAIQSDPKFIDVRLMLGGIYSMNNESESALSEYDAVLRIDPKNDEAAVFKTQVLVEKDRASEALAFIRKFVSKVKDSGAAWYYVAKLEQSQNHTNEAVAAYRKALELRPGFSQATLALGLIFESHGENKKALEIYQDQLEQKQDIQIAGRLAVLYLKMNRLDLAQKTLETMVLLDPEDLNTQLKLGLVHMQKLEWTEAKKVFLDILKKVPDSDKVNYYLAAVYEEAGEWPKSIEHLSRISVDSKLFEEANLHTAEVYRRLMQKDKAFDVLVAAIKKSPENPGFYLALAGYYEDERQVKKAAQTLADGLKIFSDNEKIRYYYGAMLDKLGQVDEAIVEMEKIISQNPKHADALNFVAYSWTSQGVRLKDAEELLKRALKLKPESPFILDSLGWNQFMLGHAKEALVYLEKAVSIKADEQAILEHLVEVYTQNQMPERASALKEKIGNLARKSRQNIKKEEQDSLDRAPASIEDQ